MAALPPPSSSSSRRSRTVDTSVGNFVIKDQIGKGSFATVYQGSHKTTGALVAIKSVNLAKLNAKLKANLEVEIEILRGLNHPHIVALIDCHESPQYIHVVMEYCELGDLSHMIKKRERMQTDPPPALRDMVRKYPMPPAGGLHEVVVRHFLKQLASAMEFLRDRDLIHRDVKPQNLLILPSREYVAKSKSPNMVMSANEQSMIPMVGLPSLPMLKIADFGFARCLPASSLAETLCGSPLYMAPEILRYEKYDAKADLWSVGTVLYEMVTGKPPFRATNHVELLRKIEQSDDHIKFPRDAVISPGMKELVRALLKKTPTDRIQFPNFWNHEVVKGQIPGLVGDDRPPVRSEAKSEDVTPMTRTSSQRSERRQTSKTEPPTHSSSPRERYAPPSPRTQAIDPVRKLSGTPPRVAPQHRPGSYEQQRQPSSREQAREQAREQTREQRRPSIVTAATAPNAETILAERRSSRTYDMTSRDQRRAPSRQESNEDGSKEDKSATHSQSPDAIAEAEQAVRDAREYVLVEKRAVEVNAFADEMAASPRLQSDARPTISARGQITRRATTQGVPVSASGALPASPSRVVQISQGKTRPEVVPQRESSYGSNPSAASAIAKALHGASARLFGVGFVPSLAGKGLSPPQLYNPFPAYPAPHGTLALLGDVRPGAPIDEDQKVVNIIEESATRSDVVYGFAEVKYKQLIPLAPSMEHGLGGPTEKHDESLVEDGLTVEAVVALSEEALVLYVKALSLLAKSMDIAGAWWTRKSRDATRIEPASSVAAGNRINSAVQWGRGRFNEVLEKTDFVRLKLIEAQKQLPEDHPGHPNHHSSSSRIEGASSTDGVFLSSGVTAERLMYDRAVEMSRSAAISEIANEDLPSVEISYVTALRMLEAVLEDDTEASPKRRRSSSLRGQVSQDDIDGLVQTEDRKAVQKIISGIRSRLVILRPKLALIARHAQSLPPSSPRPTSIIHSGGTTPTIANTPPH